MADSGDDINGCTVAVANIVVEPIVRAVNLCGDLA